MPPQRCTPSILIVDADDGIRTAVRFLLEDAGYTVSEAQTGRELVSYLLSNPDASVILLDISWPRLEDMMLPEWIFSSELPTARHAFVLMSTNPAHALGSALDRALAIGVRVISKPFDIDDLLDAVMSATRRVLGGHAAEKAHDVPTLVSMCACPLPGEGCCM